MKSSPPTFTAAHTLRNRISFTRDDGTPLNYTLVNIADWCKNTFEVVGQLCINTDYNHHRYDVILLINGIPAAQIELKTLGINPRRVIEPIVDYKNDAGNGYTNTALARPALWPQRAAQFRGGHRTCVVRAWPLMLGAHEYLRRSRM